MEKPASGIILADKPEGISSQLLVSRFKRIYGTKSAGHTGTLDPIATGLNLICFGRATKVCEYITGCDKAYIACMQLGLETDTGDTTGTATAESSIRCTAADVAAILPRFTGELDQIPPVYSAIKVGGRKLYELARAGKAPEPEPRHVTIYALELLEANEPAQRFTLRITCSKGTYIRSLCRDIGRALNTFGTMAALRRTVVGAFSVSDALTPDALAERVAAGDYSFVLPVDAAFAQLGRMTLNAKGERFLKTGLDVPAACASEAPGNPSGRQRFYAASGEFLAVGIVQGEALNIEKRFVVTEPVKQTGETAF